MCCPIFIYLLFSYTLNYCPPLLARQANVVVVPFPHRIIILLWSGKKQNFFFVSIRFPRLLSDPIDSSSVDNVIISTSLGSYFYDSTRSGFVSKTLFASSPISCYCLSRPAACCIPPPLSPHGPIRLCLILPSGSLRLLLFYDPHFQQREC